MVQTVFKSFKDLDDYLTEMDMLDMEELTDAILTEAEMEGEAEAE